MEAGKFIGHLDFSKLPAWLFSAHSSLIFPLDEKQQGCSGGRDFEVEKVEVEKIRRCVIRRGYAAQEVLALNEQGVLRDVWSSLFGLVG